MENNDYHSLYNDGTSGTDDLRAQTQANDQQSDQDVDQLLAVALPALESGQGVEQILGGQFANLPEHIKQALRARMNEHLAQKAAQEHEMARQTREKMAEKKEAGVAFSLTMAAQLITRETFDKIKGIFSKRPDIAQQVEKYGQVLARHGVTPDMVRVTTAQLGEMSPPVVGVAQQKGQERGV